MESLKGNLHSYWFGTSFRQPPVFCGCWKCADPPGPIGLSCQCLIERRLSAPFRFPPQRHPRCRPGGRIDLCPAGRSHVVRLQEGRPLFPPPPHLRQRLLQTNQHAVVRVGWKRAHHRHKCILRTVALSGDFLLLRSLRSSTHQLTIRDVNAAVPTPQDSNEVTTAELSLFFSTGKFFEGSLLFLSFICFY